MGTLRTLYVNGNSFIEKHKTYEWSVAFSGPFARLTAFKGHPLCFHVFIYSSFHSFVYLLFYFHTYLFVSFSLNLLTHSCIDFTAGRQVLKVDAVDGGSVAPPRGKSPNCCLKTKERDIEGDGLRVTQTHHAELSGGQFGKWGLP